MIREPAGLLEEERKGPRPAWALVAAPLAFVGLGLLSRAGSVEDDPPIPRADPEPARLCGRRHPGGGESSAFDPGAVLKAYRDLEGLLGKAPRKPVPEFSLRLDGPISSGLPACRGESVRTSSLAKGEASRLRGRVLYFAELRGTERRLEQPREIAENPSAEILILGIGSLGALPDLERQLGRPVLLAAADLARAWGVRCTNTWVRVPEKGDELELHEGR